MIKNRTLIEVEVKGRDFRLECSADSPLPDVIEAATLIHNFLNERLKVASQQNEDPKKEQE